jgi:hypothetical protein
LSALLPADRGIVAGQHIVAGSTESSGDGAGILGSEEDFELTLSRIALSENSIEVHVPRLAVSLPSGASRSMQV